jgi:hypothetical protein
MSNTNENFNNGAVGWSNNTTRIVGGEQVHGRFSGNQDVEATFAVSPSAASYTVEFDFYELDSWDGEYFYVYVDGKTINLGRFSGNSDESGYQKFGTTSDGIEWSIVSGAVQDLSNTVSR